MDFKVGDKVKVISVNNSFGIFSTKETMLTFLNKTFTVYNTFIISVPLHDTIQYYVTVKENDYYWNIKDLILVNNNLEIE